MTSPKEALKVAESYLKAECLKPGDRYENEQLHQMIIAAIPVAELEHQAVELLGKIRRSLWGAYAARAEDILTQLEALK